MYSLSIKNDNLVYKYSAGKHMVFKFNLLSEVGAPYQQWFIDEIKRRGWVVDYGVEIDNSPWIADRLLYIKSPRNVL